MTLVLSRCALIIMTLLFCNLCVRARQTLPVNTQHSPERTQAVEKWLQSRAIPLKSVQPGVSVDDLKPLESILAGVRIVGLGLVAGAHLFDRDVRVTAIAVSERDTQIAEDVLELAQQIVDEFAAEGVAAGPINPSEVIVRHEYVGDGYGRASAASLAAMQEAAEREALLDPIYSGKAMLGLIELCPAHYFKPGENVVFVHTGGLPSLFPYRDTIAPRIQKSNEDGPA